MPTTSAPPKGASTIRRTQDRSCQGRVRDLSCIICVPANDRPLLQIASRLGAEFSKLSRESRDGLPGLRTVKVRAQHVPSGFQSQFHVRPDGGTVISLTGILVTLDVCLTQRQMRGRLAGVTQNGLIGQPRSFAWRVSPPCGSREPGSIATRLKRDNARTHEHIAIHDAPRPLDLHGHGNVKRLSREPRPLRR